MTEPTGSGPKAEAPAPDLNDAQRRTIFYGLLNLHRRMVEMEAFIVQAQNPSPFSQYVNDLSPTEARVVQDYFSRLRAAMQTCLEETGIPLEPRRTGLRWALLVGGSFLHVAVSDMGPEKLRGYGPLGEDGRAAAVKIQQELTRLINWVGTYLRQGLGHDLAGRLARLEAAPATRAALNALEGVVTRQGLVEFRPALDQVVRRLEAPQLEIAFFGRVSSGKSSLLNHVAGVDVLPVGVTPITAVPTRLVRGDQPAALITFAETEPRTIAVEELRDYASEEGNPGNRKHVTGIQVQLPPPHLREGVVLVDTPGVGSLARAGGGETLAYLPRCDLGVVLIDAASTLTPDDLLLLRQLYEAAVPAQVVLSKADLLTPADRQRTVDYVRAQRRQELGLDLPVYPVSTVGPDEALLPHWFEQEIEPLLARHRALAEASLRRKLAHLRESVIAVLETLLARHQGGAAEGGTPAEPKAVRRLLDEADEAVRQARARCQDWTADEPALLEVLFQDVAQAIVNPSPAPESTPAEPVLRVVERVLTERGTMAYRLVEDLKQVLGRTLEKLSRAALLADVDPAALTKVVLGGMPLLDLSPLRGKAAASRPWWASVLPRIAVWAARRSLQENLGKALREFVELYDRQLRAWVKGYIAQLVELYESQAEVCREQARRLTAPAGETDKTSDVGQLAADLKELQEASAP